MYESDFNPCNSQRERERENMKESVWWSERRNVGVAVDESLGRN